MGLKQNILISSFVWLAALSLAACASVAESAPESQQAPVFVPIPSNAPQAQPVTTVVKQAAVDAHAEMQPIVSTTFVEWSPDGPMVEGAESTLVRMEHGFYATFNAVELEPGDVYTMWWVIFNRPENCSDGECGLNDVFIFDENGERQFSDDGAPIWNRTAHAAVEFALGRATGTVVDTDGTAEFRAHLPVGDDTEFDFGSGLLNPAKAEVHLIIRTHSQIIPGSLHEQLGSAWGGCPAGWPKDPCKDMQVAIHMASR